MTERYAIGGAVAATIYLEPFSTLDVDVFIDRVKRRMESIEASKSRMRRKLAARPVAEKLRMLDDLRARAVTLKRPTRKDRSGSDQDDPEARGLDPS